MTQQLSLDDITTDEPTEEDDAETIEVNRVAVTYARSNDNTQQQLQRGIEHAQNELRYDVAIIISQKANDQASGSIAVRDNETRDAIAVMHEDHDTHPREIEHVIDSVREYPVEDVIVDHVASLSDSIEDIVEVVEIVNGEGATVHALDDDLTIPPDAGEVRAALRAAAHTNNDAKPRVTGEKHSGRPPAGFEVVEGKLRKADDYDELRNALINVIEHDATHADAVRATDYSRATIISCKRQRNRYNLPADDEDE